jgi:hypothetical protein
MTIEELRTELAMIISSLTSSGFNNADSNILDKLSKLILATGESGMKEAKRLLENLLGAIKAIQEGKSQPESGTVRLTALDFYLKNLPSSENIEDI